MTKKQSPLRSQQSWELWAQAVGQDKDLVRGLSEMRSEGTNLEKGYNNTWWDWRPMIEE